MDFNEHGSWIQRCRPTLSYLLNLTNFTELTLIKRSYQTRLTKLEIEKRVKEFPKSQLVLLPRRWYYSKVEGDILISKTLFYVVRATIEEHMSGNKLILSSRYRFIWYLLLIWFLAWVPITLFAEDVTINGNPDPDLITRISFVSIWCAFLAIPVGITLKHKHKFVRTIEEKLELRHFLSDSTSG